MEKANESGDSVNRVVPLPSSRTCDDTDWSQLLARMAETGDRALFVQIFRHYGPLLKSYMLRLGVLDSVVEELVQESMLTIWRKAKTFNPERAEAGAWIYTLARNKAIDWMRKQKYPTYSLEGHEEEPQEGETEPGELHLIRHKMKTALNELPPEQAQVIYMSYYEGRAHSEIAAKLGIPLGSVKARIRLASAKLRNFWEGEQ
ncbi:sigma-70 family RNA polymerase sigma factor [Marinobacterium sp. D7]|uniref:sigma-70 family RNA polymerase sigma factor n=1 Tax=Marinobacterium ramblicola TaxID=2849041 RepID=UPI001C2D9A7F|nr:sigma-70 family RNA polymerase sigma factor [Marinobacterium ramblicola]MBV1788165.1 sigma-70 family RNA polymerase sigma factor [Marinobacterium ramblicola]